MNVLLATSLYLMCMCQWAESAKDDPFECYVCNKEPHENDSAPCVDRVERCPANVTSCSSVAFRSPNGKTRVRKFCTSPGVPIYQYLMLLPGSSLCQNIETTSMPDPPAEPLIRRNSSGKPVVILPPAPPSRGEATLLCVCTKPKCNAGSYREVMQKSMLRNFEGPDGTSSSRDSKKKEANGTSPGQESKKEDVPFNRIEQEDENNIF